MTEVLESTIAHTALLQAPLGVVLIDGERRVAWLNPAAERLLGMARDQLLGHTADSVAPPWREAVFAPADTLCLEEQANGSARWLQTWRNAGEDGHTIHYYADISELQHALGERTRLSAELAQHNTRDPVTGLPNRHALLQGIEPLVSRSRRYHNPLSVIRLRLDNLPELEAEHGKGSGDAALVAVARMLKDQMRWADMVGRFETDEFLLVLPETAANAANLLKEKLQQRVLQLEAKDGNGRPMRLAAQFGVADWQQGDDRAKMLKRARQELERGV